MRETTQHLGLGECFSSSFVSVQVKRNISFWLKTCYEFSGAPGDQTSMSIVVVGK